jgi:thioredoxin 2
MSEGSVLLRCRLCATVNRIATNRLTDRPKCGRCKALLEFPKTPVEVTAANFDGEVLGSPGAVLVFFWAPWCAHCRAMIPIIEGLGRQRAGMIKVATVNTEKESLLARRFDILSVPRLELYRNGKKINELNGAVKKQDLEVWLDNLMRLQ